MTLSIKGLYVTLSIIMLCHYAECRVLYFITLNLIMMSVVMLNVIILSVVMLNVIMWSVMAPQIQVFS